MDSSQSGEQISSLLLQLSLTLHNAFLYGFMLVSLASFIYKGVMLPYPPTGALTWEVVLLFLYYVVSSTRLFQAAKAFGSAASKGNRTKQIPALVLSIILAVPLVICNVFFVQLQTYVLRLDGIVNGIALAFLCWEVLLSVLTLLTVLGQRVH
ncbi:hypothetical protein P43SY_005262 [Pythium insidiosum]|uniref:Transmembrane protein n=1 Tax=Pythium insidiosum TaxID=114742 RepID=A0AAD5M083_PYTIN|nr:hypothetical protein P43SY_005262 [Pythium insidiosum]